MQDTVGRAPRLRMGHLLIWIVGCAIGLAVHRPVAVPRLTSDRDRVLVIGSSVTSGIALGTMLAGCGLLAYRRWRGDPSCPSRAGHWLLLRGLAVHTPVAVFSHLHLRLPAFQWYWYAVLIDLVFYRGLRRRLPRHWVAVFLVSVVLAVVRATAFSAFLFTNRSVDVVIGSGSVLVDVLVMLRAIDRDRRSDAPADGLHRLGVVTVLALDAIHIAFWLVFLFW